MSFIYVCSVNEIHLICLHPVSIRLIYVAKNFKMYYSITLTFHKVV